MASLVGWLCWVLCGIFPVPTYNIVGTPFRRWGSWGSETLVFSHHHFRTILRAVVSEPYSVWRPLSYVTSSLWATAWRVIPPHGSFPELVHGIRACSLHLGLNIFQLKPFLIPHSLTANILSIDLSGPCCLYSCLLCYTLSRWLRIVSFMAGSWWLCTGNDNFCLWCFHMTQTCQNAILEFDSSVTNLTIHCIWFSF